MSEVPASTPAAVAPAPTGVESVDAVLDLVAGLDERPLSEHVVVFEQAHAQLRQALDAQPTDTDAPA